MWWPLTHTRSKSVQWMKICTLHPTNPEARFRIVSVKGLPVGCPRTCPLQAHGDLFAAPSRSASAPSIAPIRGLCVWVLPKECHRCLKWSPSLQGEKCQCDENSVLPLIRLYSGTDLCLPPVWPWRADMRSHLPPRYGIGPWLLWWLARWWWSWKLEWSMKDWRLWGDVQTPGLLHCHAHYPLSLRGLLDVGLLSASVSIG